MPPLPKGVVTEEIVNSLDRYSTYDQNAWASSLSPLAAQVYRQLLADKEAKRRGGAGVGGVNSHASPIPQPLQSPNMMSQPPILRSTSNGASPLPERIPPAQPSITHIDFVFASDGVVDKSSTIRVHNIRGVITHALVLSSETSDLEITVYYGSPSNPAEMPALSLRLNAQQGASPTPVPLAEESKFRAARWTISVPTDKADSKIELVASRPGTAPEVTSVYLTKQYK